MHCLEIDHITKTFPGVKALENVSFGVSAGSVHALCGENGAGKSTLLKILSGVHIPDSGELRLAGTRLSFGSAKESLESGIAVIYQELNDVLDLSVAENIWLGHLPHRFGLVNHSELAKKTKFGLQKVGLDISPWTKMRSLSLAQRQMVEIAKALTHDAQVIAFDEPTSSLSSREVERLFEIIAELKSSGKAILYVSHRMDEIFQICDAATILRDGQWVETFQDISMTNASGLIERMVGRKIEDVFGYDERPIGNTVLEAKNLFGPILRDEPGFTVHSGEIVGIFGLVGAGRSEILKAVYEGNGEVRINGKAINGKGPRASIEVGIVLCPEDRKKEGIIPLLSVSENINLSVRRRTSRFGFLLNKSVDEKNSNHFIEKLGVRTPNGKTPIRNLSGGNQQKVILGRWLSEKIQVVLLDEPTRGIDVGAKSEIYSIIQDLAKSGVGVVMVSSELPEVMGICDRILVMENGRFTGEVQRGEATEERLLKLALPSSEIGVSA